jgi:hypothetical protein
VTRDRSAKTIRLDQTAYVAEVLQRYGMQDSSPVSTPIVTKERLTAAQSPDTPEDKQAVLEFSKGISYPEQVGALLYVTQTRPDIQYAVSSLAQFSVNPRKAHFEGVKRVLRYLKGTAHFGLVLGGSDNRIDFGGLDRLGLGAGSQFTALSWRICV